MDLGNPTENTPPAHVMNEVDEEQMKAWINEYKYEKFVLVDGDQQPIFQYLGKELANTFLGLLTEENTAVIYTANSSRWNEKANALGRRLETQHANLFVKIVDVELQFVDYFLEDAVRILEGKLMYVLTNDGRLGDAARLFDKASWPTLSKTGLEGHVLLRKELKKTIFVKNAEKCGKPDKTRKPQEALDDLLKMIDAAGVSL